MRYTGQLPGVIRPLASSLYYTFSSFFITLLTLNRDNLFLLPLILLHRGTEKASFFKKSKIYYYCFLLYQSKRRDVSRDSSKAFFGLEVHRPKLFYRLSCREHE